MQLRKLLAESLEIDSIDCWENERTASALRAFGVRLHMTGRLATSRESMGLTEVDNVADHR